jgi:protease-4
MASSIRALGRRVLRSYVLFVVLGLIVGLVLAPVAFDLSSGPSDTVAVVPLEGSIDGASANAVSAQLDRARTDSSVKAIVIVANSGGGTAAGSETLYLASKRAAEAKPVVASVDAAAASGAYYTIAPADAIYTKPSSVVGSIGVRAPLPLDVEPNDLEGTTGPNKLTGYDQREFYYVLESLRRAFVGAVIESRGDRLTLSESEVSQAQIYSGGQAVGNGLADEIGDRNAAIEEAARRANLDSYRVRVYRPDGTTTFVSRANYLASDAPDKELVPMSRYVSRDSGVPLFLMMPGGYFEGTRVNAVDASRLAPADVEADPAPIGDVSTPEAGSGTTATNETAPGRVAVPGVGR